jgi:hypothetical protein
METNKTEGSKQSWATTGFGGNQKEEQRLATLYGPNRVWIKAGGSQEWVFIDDEPLCIHEHNPKINGDWKNWLTCLQNISEDGVPCCEILGAKSRYYVGYFTVVDLSKWTDKKGNVHQYEVKLLPAKLQTLKKLARKKEDKGSLIGALYKVHRETEKSPSCGDDFEYIRDADLSKLFEVANYKGKKLSELYGKAVEDPVVAHMLKQTFNLKYGDDNKILPKIAPFNYLSLFEPKSAKDVRSFLKGAKIEGWDDSKGGGEKGGGGSSADEEVPF